MYSSLIVWSLVEQSANLPGKELESNGDFLLTASLAACERIRDSLAKLILLMINAASLGFSFKNFSKIADVTLFTTARTSVLPNFCFVWPSYCGSGCLTETIAAKP